MFTVLSQQLKTKMLPVYDCFLRDTQWHFNHKIMLRRNILLQTILYVKWKNLKQTIHTTAYTVGKQHQEEDLLCSYSSHLNVKPKMKHFIISLKYM